MNHRLGKTRWRIAPAILVSGIMVQGGFALGQGWTLATNLTLKAELTVRETYDDNVYILNTDPNPAIARPAGFTISTPYKESFVTAVTPGLSLTYRPCAATAATLSYAPEVVTYHSAHSEDYVAHRGALNLTGTIGNVSYENLNGITWIDGSGNGPVTVRPGDCRAIGGIPLRDRRDALIFRDGLKCTIAVGKWFFRPVMTAYVHDFRTEQLPNLQSTNYIYDNFIDRWEVNGGLDIGYEAFPRTKLVIGYRYGHQEQGDLLGKSSPYSSDYQRFLLGIEGAPEAWLKLALLAGPEVRNWCSSTPAGFNRNELLWYVDAAVTVLPTKKDTIMLRATRFEQPAFTSHSVYQDIRYDITWRHKFTPKLTAGAGFTLHIGDWQDPAMRDDWIYTPSVMASYAVSAHLSAELSWSCDWAKNREDPVAVTATEYAEGREYTRNLVSLTLKYTF